MWTVKPNHHASRSVFHRYHSPYIFLSIAAVYVQKLIYNGLALHHISSWFMTDTTVILSLCKCHTLMVDRQMHLYNDRGLKLERDQKGSHITWLVEISCTLLSIKLFASFFSSSRYLPTVQFCFLALHIIGGAITAKETWGHKALVGSGPL